MKFRALIPFIEALQALLDMGYDIGDISLSVREGEIKPLFRGDVFQFFKVLNRKTGNNVHGVSSRELATFLKREHPTLENEPPISNMVRWIKWFRYHTKASLKLAHDIWIQRKEGVLSNDELREFFER